jgi:hypothetical protein
VVDINIDRLFHFESNDKKRLVRTCLSTLFCRKIFSFYFFAVHNNHNLQSSSTIKFTRYFLLNNLRDSFNRLIYFVFSHSVIAYTIVRCSNAKV